MPLSFVALLLSLAAAAPQAAEAPPAAAPAEAAPAAGAAPSQAPEAAQVPPRPPTLREVNLARAEKGLLPRKAPPRRAPRRLRVVSAREQVARAQQVDGAAPSDAVPAAAQAEAVAVLAPTAPDLVAPPPVSGGSAASLAGAVIRGLAAARPAALRGPPSARVEAEPGGLRAGARGATLEVTVRARAGALALAAGPGAARAR